MITILRHLQRSSAGHRRIIVIIFIDPSCFVPDLEYSCFMFLSCIYKKCLTLSLSYPLVLSSSL